MSKASSPASAPTTLVSSPHALVAESTEVEIKPPHIPGIVVIQATQSSSPSAYTTKGTPTTYFSLTDISSDLKLLLRRAPTVSWTDRRGNRRTVKAGIYLDCLPADISRPKLTRVNAAEADVAAPVAATSATAAAMKGRKPGKKPAGATGEQATKTEKGTVEAAPAALAPAGVATATNKPAVMAKAPVKRPKGLEIDMVAGAFMAVGERGSRPKKRPARFDDGVEEGMEAKRRKESAGR
ncbi:MAG: hypothetical protein Q9196_005642 [Gyalolechia fulgens]